MEFGIEKCAMLVINSGKRNLIEGMEQTNKTREKETYKYLEKRKPTNTWRKGNLQILGEKETYKYLDILEADIIKQVEMKEKI